MARKKPAKPPPKKAAKSARRKPAAKKPAKAPKPARPPVQTPTPPPDPYAAHRERAAARGREASRAGREIGPIPDIADIERRERCRGSLQLFCETYNPMAFPLSWSADHLKAIARIEEAVLRGALFALAMPRGSGKTTICRMATLWSISYALCRYSFVIGATGLKAEDTLDAIKTFIRFLDAYAEDFPEVSFPARRLAGIAQRATGQTCGGLSTQIEWDKGRLVLPTVPPPANWPRTWPLRADGMVPTSGGVISASGLTGEGIRGSLLTLTTGESVRPDFVLLDDPQTPESARSPTQNLAREKLVSADVLGMAGPGKSIAAVMPCTVIEPGDFIDTILDRSKHPLWRGERTQMLRSMPKNLAAWEDYFEIYRDGMQREPPDLTEANEAYAARRAELDAGAVASWPARKLEGEVSAIQHAMHLYCRDRRGFMSEYQNAPVTEAALDDLRQLEERHLVAKLNQQKRGDVPRECSRLTAFVDVQQEVLFWAICGWTDRFGGALVDYGVFPKQRRDVFTAAEPSRKLSDEYPGIESRARIYRALSEIVPQIVGRSFRQADAAGGLTVSLALIDAGYETDAIHEFLSRSPLKALLKASKGKYVGAAAKPMNDYRKEPGDVVGWNWRIDAKTQAKGRFVSFDANAWKSTVAEAFLAPPGSSGSFYLCGAKINEHPLLAVHLLSEYRVPTFGQGRRVEEWRRRPNGYENHWWDCLVGCAVAASVTGLKWSAASAAGEQPAGDGPKKKRNFAEMQAKARAKREGGSR